MHPLRRLARDLGGLAFVIGLILLVTFLPADTSLRQVRANGAIRACVPNLYPPLVTGEDDRPGIDIEILRAMAEKMDLRLLLSPIDAMGRDFNPRNWAINRAKCEVLAGGVLDSPLTRSFLDTSPPYAETGWALLAPVPLADLTGRTIGALTILSGLDRIGLASLLRREGVELRVVPNEAALVEGIGSATLDAGVTEALLAAFIAAEQGWWSAPISEELAGYRLVFGLWKGDLTLKREVVAAFRTIEADGTLEEILARYGARPLGERPSAL